MVVMLIERTNLDSELFLNTQRRFGHLRIVLVIALKFELVDHMSKVMNGAILQIWDEFTDVITVALEALTKAEYETRLDLLDPNSARNATSVFCLGLDLLRPTFLFALVDSFGIGERPTTLHICFSDGFTCLTTSTFGFQTTIAGTTIPRFAYRNHAGEIVFEVADDVLLGVWNALLVQPDFDNIV